MHADSTDAKVFRFDQSRALLRKVMESAAVGMALVGVDGRMIHVNRAYEAMMGLEPGVALGRQNVQFLHPDDRQAVQLRFAQLFRGETEEFQLECRINHHDGGTRWVLASVSLLRSDTTQRPLYGIVQLIDIDRQKRAEQALAESESRWHNALESAGQGVWDHDIRKDDMFYSRMWRSMRGIPDGEHVDPAQEGWLARMHPDDVPRIRAIVAKQDSGEDGYDTLEYRERHRDGRWIWILSRGKPIEWDENGVPLRTVGTDTDITRIKVAEARLAEEKERFRVTLDSIGEGVIAADAGGCVQYMNPIAEMLTGWSLGEALGVPLARVFVTKHEATGETAADVMVACLASGCTREIEGDVILAARNGTGRGISGTASPVRDEAGRTIGAVLVFKDVTDLLEEQRRLTHSANHDVLTGLPNRSAFARALAEAHRQVAGGNRSHALCFIDLDRFKPVNDTAGHAAGDALLREVAAVIRSCCRVQDVAARMGGDEFVVLLADCTVANARRVGQKIVDAISAVRFGWNGAEYTIGASVGVAPLSASTEDNALAAADAACYAAKAGGRGRVVVAAAG